jgi:integrase
MNERTGYTAKDKNGRWFARITITHTNGRRKDIKRLASGKGDASAILKQLARGFDDEGARYAESIKSTFADLADYYETHYAIPAKFVDGQKIAGLRGAYNVLTYVKVFRAYFGHRALREITYADLTAFRSKRLQTRTYKGSERSITTVNRELAHLRRMFNIALQNGWVLRNPFACGDPLILTSCERRRERILTVDEEARLLQACDNPRRIRLRALLIALLDTGARKGEVLKLKWCDVDLHSRTVIFQAQNTKTLRERTVAITERFAAELTRLWNASDGDMKALVFDGVRDVRGAFSTACRIADIDHGGIDGLTLHCLRHTAATRLVKGQLPIQLVGRILGHTQVNTTYRYLTADNETAKQAASILESYQSLEKRSEP